MSSKGDRATSLGVTETTALLSTYFSLRIASGRPRYTTCWATSMTRGVVGLFDPRASQTGVIGLYAAELRARIRRINRVVVSSRGSSARLDLDWDLLAFQSRETVRAVI